MNSEDQPGEGKLTAVETLDAWRARGDDRLDPVRFHFISALARKAAAHSGSTRQLLDGKLARLMQAYAEDLGHLPPVPPRAVKAKGKQAQPQGPLGALAAHAAQHASQVVGDGMPASPAAPVLSSVPPELKSLSHFRSTLSRLSADRRMTQSLAKVPENAGPLNSHHLVHRSLTLMRDLSPQYLHRFMSYVDALTWVNQANAATASATPGTSRAESPKKASRRKAG